ncbi:MAG: hypothetical protein JWO05_1477 [Gemmatimonadetes bacterium]|nr:hypothetical protein [Gemmatimonadota bacterium]
MIHRTRILMLAGAILSTIGTGCANQQGSTGKPSTAEYDTPPMILAGVGGAPTRLTIAVERVSGSSTGPGTGSKRTLSYAWDVLVDTLGHADISTLHLSGRDADMIREEFPALVSRMRFQPARKAGRNVAAVYRQAAR